MKSKRLTYRPLDYSDAARITEFAGDWDVARMTARIPYPYTAHPGAPVDRQPRDGEFVRVVELERELIGAVGYTPNADGSPEIGYWIGRPWWGQGFATEAAAALVALLLHRHRRRPSHLLPLRRQPGLGAHHQEARVPADRPLHGLVRGARSRM